MDISHSGYKQPIKSHLTKGFAAEATRREKPTRTETPVIKYDYKEQQVLLACLCIEQNSFS